MSEYKAKLLPLRRFSLDGQYNTAYLSLLVQRNKLQAKKIGRNYFTTIEWFTEYLDCHARTETRIAYEQHFAQIEAEKNDYANHNGHNGNNILLAAPISQPVLLSQPAINSAKFKILTAVVITAAVFILLFSALLISRQAENGQVAGESEVFDQIINK